ncbi:short chain dehydrogenase family protein [Mycobacterium kansasii]|uniref:Short chain dehydrogenase family protein n=1 Tax=Mycobacterium kansasii TaxID=1768 RepID=A0A1V3WJH0_MYCKA|nr:short chain dehydrogenase family protein [Mycobacterium kansasii]
MSLPKPNKQATVVITGASSGIGVELARGLARRGFPLMLVARRRERLEELADQLRAEFSVGVEVLPLDLADAQARAQLADRLGTDEIAGLCNSAGFGTSGRFYELSPERESEQVTLNALALMELTRAALPGMVERGAGAVLNIASIAGFQPIPFMAVYSASKAFVLTFSEAVQEELHGTGVSVTALCRARCLPSGRRSPVPSGSAFPSRRCRRERSPKPRSAGCLPANAPWCRVRCPSWSAPAADSYREPCCCPRSGSATGCAGDPVAKACHLTSHLSQWCLDRRRAGAGRPAICPPQLENSK